MKVRVTVVLEKEAESVDLAAKYIASWKELIAEVAPIKSWKEQVLNR